MGGIWVGWLVGWFGRLVDGLAEVRSGTTCLEHPFGWDSIYGKMVLGMAKINASDT